MVGIVIVSHSKKLAEGVVELAKQMTGGKDVVIKAAGGLEDGSLGTSFDKIVSAINEAYSDDGVLILMDLGSAVMTAQMAVEFLPEDMQKKVVLCNAPLVEGALAAAAAAANGLSLIEVKKEAESVNTNKVQTDEKADNLPFDINDKDVYYADVKIVNPTGLHARPAASFVAAASSFEDEIWVKNITEDKPYANAKSLMDMAINGTAEKGQLIRIVAKGPTAKKAVEELKKLVESGFGEIEQKDQKGLQDQEQKEKHKEEQKSKEITKDVFKGEPVYEGYVIGKAFIHKREQKASFVQDQSKKAVDPQKELKRVEDAITKAKEELYRLKKKIDTKGDKNVSEIFDFHRMVLEDKSLISKIEHYIKEKGLTAEESIYNAFDELSEALTQKATGLMKTRAVDIVDLKNRLLSILQGKDTGSLLKKLKELRDRKDLVLIADELLPSEAAELDKDIIKAIVTAKGGTTSHAAILSRMWGIPSVVGVGEGILLLKDGTTIVVDAHKGEVLVNPSEEIIKSYQHKAKELSIKQKQLKEQALKPAITKDGLRRIEVVANVGNVESVKEIFDYGAEGIGLLRTEFLFLKRDTMPSEEEQYKALKDVAIITKDAPVIVRTLDIGGDKPVNYIKLEKEENPFLGVRAIRLHKLYPELLTTQIRAILRASMYGNFKIMFPMVATVEEVNMLNDLVVECAKQLKEKGISVDLDKIEVGIMVEIPSAAILSDILAKKVDFFSIGTNDLTQYTLACDRGNKNLSYLYNSLNPAVLRLIKDVVDSAHANGKWVGVCGEMAGQKKAIPILVGLGVDELSMSARLIPEAKDLIRRFDYDYFKSVALEAVNLESAEAVEKLIAERFGV